MGIVVWVDGDCWSSLELPASIIKDIMCEMSHILKICDLFVESLCLCVCVCVCVCVRERERERERDLTS